MPRSLLKDIDLETMYSMRREGMGNKDIAGALGISRNTVYRYIGPQPKELDRRKNERPRNILPSEPDTPPPACLVVDNRDVHLVGTYGSYTIDTKAYTIEVTNSCGDKMCVNKDQLEDFINELSAIKRKLPELGHRNEMW